MLPERTGVAGCLCFHLRRSARTVTRRFDSAMRPHGISAPRFSLLMCIGERAPIAFRDLATLTALDRSTLSRDVRVLERDGFVRSEITERDGRLRLLVLTESGRAMLGAGLPRWREAESALLAASGGVEIARLLDGLEKCVGFANRRVDLVD